MKIHAFKIETTPPSKSFEEVLQTIEKQDSLKERVRSISSSLIRAEELEKSEAGWLIDFVRIRKLMAPGELAWILKLRVFNLKRKKALEKKLQLSLFLKPTTFLSNTTIMVSGQARSLST